MVKPKPTKGNGQQAESNIVAVRFPPELLAALDNEVTRRQKAAPWSEITRADVIRESLYRTIHALEHTPPEEKSPALALVATPIASPSLKEPSATPGLCRICQDSLPEGRKALCGKESCTKEDKNARERERKRTLRTPTPRTLTA